MTEIHYKGIHHPAFVTQDMGKTIRFWRDLLGLKLIYTVGGPGDRQAFFDAGLGNRLVFFEWPNVEDIPYKRHGEPQDGPCVFDHVAIAVADEESLWEIMARLDAAEFPVSDMIDHGYCRSIYGYDPNRLPIEFLCPSPRVDLDRLPVFADTDPVEAAQEGPDPQPGHWPEPEPIVDEERLIAPGAGREDFPKRNLE